MELSCIRGGEERYSRALQEPINADAVEDVRRKGVW